MSEVTQSFVRATYRLRDRLEHLEKRASAMAIGLTIGTWTELPQIRTDQLSLHCGQVEDISVREELSKNEVIADVSILYPVANLDGTFASLLTTVFGKLSMDGEIRLIELELPDSLMRQFPGPKFGVSGCRTRYQVDEGPLLMSIFKACIGLTLPELLDAFEAQARGGVHLVKDDEIFFTDAYATPEERVVGYREIAKRVAETTGQETAYAVNLTGSVQTLSDKAKRLADSGAGALLVNVIAYGYDVVSDLARDPDIHVPILAHPAMSGALYGGDRYGIAADVVLGQLMRFAGADMVIFPSMYGSVTLGDDETAKLLHHLRVQGAHQDVLPAPSAGIYPGLVGKLYEDFGDDLIINAGGGIHGHPKGATAGGQAFLAAIDAVKNGTSLSVAATSSEELKVAIDKWGMSE